MVSFSSRSDSADRTDSVGEAAQKCSYYIHTYKVNALLFSFPGISRSAGRYNFGGRADSGGEENKLHFYPYMLTILTLVT